MEQVDLQGRKAVIAGGTGGIGGGIATRLASLGADVTIAGRKKEMADRQIEDMKRVAVSPNQTFRFIQVDLSLIAENKKLVEDVIQNDKRVDYLILSQGSPPAGEYKQTSEGLEEGFAVFVVSKVLLATQLKDYTDTTVMIGIAGMTPKDESLDLNDLTLENANSKGKFGFVIQGRRNALSLDVLAEELGRRNPEKRFFHLNPGMVKSQAFSNSNANSWLKRPLQWALNLFGSQPLEYAKVPVDILINSKFKEEYVQNGTKFYDQHSRPIAPSPLVLNDQTRENVFKKLVEFAGL
eukprot:TRINITY_DN3452_c0_g1_i1.p1 TRINITY_DN3452_c0_g1~~TRINITY_DN3452_c0_g1_i1.p1  ORF type:complete len:295 (-),score=116.31 TRINITY_DN3452_c0_g1_i1:494-1378(-)